jgi:hypothetical protein
MADHDDEISEGYRDGRADDRETLPESLANRSAFYRFGWENGRDDRMHRPRKLAQEIRDELAALEATVDG